MKCISNIFGNDIIIRGLSPPLAVLTFARLRTIFFSFNKKHSSHAKSKAKIVLIKKRDLSQIVVEITKGNTLVSYSSTNKELDEG